MTDGEAEQRLDVCFSHKQSGVSWMQEASAKADFSCWDSGGIEENLVMKTTEKKKNNVLPEEIKILFGGP